MFDFETVIKRKDSIALDIPKNDIDKIAEQFQSVFIFIVQIGKINNQGSIKGWIYFAGNDSFGSYFKLFWVYIICVIYTKRSA